MSECHEDILAFQLNFFSFFFSSNYAEPQLAFLHKSITDFTCICTTFYILQNAFTFFTIFDLTYLNKAASNELPFGNVFWDFSFKQNNYLSVSGVSCFVARGILVPWPGIEPTSPAFESQILNHQTTEEVLKLIFRTTKLCRTFCSVLFCRQFNIKLEVKI